MRVWNWAQRSCVFVGCVNFTWVNVVDLDSKDMFPWVALLVQFVRTRSLDAWVFLLVCGVGGGAQASACVRALGVECGDGVNMFMPLELPDLLGENP